MHVIALVALLAADPVPVEELAVSEGTVEVIGRYQECLDLNLKLRGSAFTFALASQEHASLLFGLRAGIDFHLGYSPERIDPGNRSWRLENTPKVVGGIDAASTDAVAAFYGAFVDTVVPVGSTEVAELTKLLENTFRHVNIALVNELAMFAHDLDIDINDAVTAAATKPFGFMSFRPGPGVGGHCLPIDPTYLSWRVRRRLGTSFRFVELANDVNDHMPDYVVRRIQAGLNDRELAVRGRNVLLCGLAYKADTSDARETPTRAIVAGLLSLGARVTLADPHVPADQFPDAALGEVAPEAAHRAAAPAAAEMMPVRRRERARQLHVPSADEKRRGHRRDRARRGIDVNLDLGTPEIHRPGGPETPFEHRPERLLERPAGARTFRVRAGAFGAHADQERCELVLLTDRENPREHILGGGQGHGARHRDSAAARRLLRNRHRIAATPAAMTTHITPS